MSPTPAWLPQIQEPQATLHRCQKVLPLAQEHRLLLLVSYVVISFCVKGNLSNSNNRVGISIAIFIIIFTVCCEINYTSMRSGMRSGSGSW